MPAFIGFNTINQNKKFTLVDSELIKRDLANSMNIIQGEMVGKPAYGTMLWSYMFENQTPETMGLILAEIQRLAGQDPRIFLQDANVYPQENGVLIELEIKLVSSSQSERLSLFLNQETRRASFI